MKKIFNHINKMIKAQKPPLMPELNVLQKQSNHLDKFLSTYILLMNSCSI